MAELKANRIWAGYRDEHRVPLGPYFWIVIVFNSLLGLTGMVALQKRAADEDQPVAERLLELAILGASIHKLSRVITRDAVTAPFRAPFTRFQKFLGYGEILEESRGGPLRSTLGDLVSCNYCTDMWVGLGFLNLEYFAPRWAAYLKRFFTAITIADFLHVRYETTRSEENVLTLREEQMEKRSSA